MWGGYAIHAGTEPVEAVRAQPGLQFDSGSPGVTQVLAVVHTARLWPENF
ncbi:MAG: hypothetical protein Q7J38_08930 [Gallionella sp.]|nr:hypothetical protein [Gallionella sp.]